MHACAWVVTTEDGSAHDVVERAMEPHRENYDVDPVTGTWDWWQLGGRYTGSFTAYDPTKDPANMEACDLCGGTGDRAKYRNEPPLHPDMKSCNGCAGMGVRVKWPTQWLDYEGDVTTPAQALASGAKCFALVMDGEFTERRPYDRVKEELVEHPDFDGFVERRLREAPEDARVIVVDYHS